MNDDEEIDTPFIDIKYVFKYEEQEAESVYRVRLDKRTFTLVHSDKEKKAEWTALENNKCSNCPLKSEDHPHCPTALGLSDFLTDFANQLSYTKAKVAVITAERTYYRDTTLQNGIYSIMGLIMATSGCPILDPLKPMARYHLPFSTMDETLIRSLAFYLLRQFFKQGGEEGASLKLDDLNKLYADIDKVNQGILQRIRAVSKRDANQNALIILDAFKSVLSSAIHDQFEDIEKYILPPKV